ncbi:nucleotide exchange factor GrpE [Candidatus Peregrinibacteria bacterium HGW-Peregrinibacteria-1]|jgi:molecular chaperone GrpE|nr:MAG: nucleotide exchange factor GrpE [Candidatus Peregrinibacteria bacterium HGW-Peregrinibacteria-1]
MSDKKEKTDKAPKQDELTKIKNELQKMTELAQRTMADLQNLKRRHEEERSTIYLSANSALIKGLLPSLDNLERTLSHQPKSIQDQETNAEWLKGLEMSINQIKQLLQLSGLEEIKSLGETFDPTFHEALLQGPGNENSIIEVLEKGYKLGDIVIRHAKVKVGNGDTSA